MCIPWKKDKKCIKAHRQEWNGTHDKLWSSPQSQLWTRQGHSSANLSTASLCSGRSFISASAIGKLLPRKRLCHKQDIHIVPGFVAGQILMQFEQDSIYQGWQRQEHAFSPPCFPNECHLQWHNALSQAQTSHTYRSTTTSFCDPLKNSLSLIWDLALAQVRHSTMSIHTQRVSFNTSIHCKCKISGFWLITKGKPPPLPDISSIEVLLKASGNEVVIETLQLKLLRGT